MKGTLADQPLAELIREISTKSFSGTLRLERERAKTAVYFEDGKVIFAASNLRTLRLREYLKKRGLVSEKKLASLDNNRPDLRLALELCANGLIQQELLDALLANLVADILRVALLWTEGYWDFDERARLGEPVNVSVNTHNLLREAAQRMPLNFVSLRFRNPHELISRSAEASRVSNFLPTESFILSRLDAPTQLAQLVAVSGLRELDAYRIIYGLALGGLVKREYWHNAFRTEHEKTIPEQPVARAHSPETPTSQTEKVDNRWALANEEDDLEVFLERVSRATNYYEIMELPSTSGGNDIKEAYYALARRYHPDRFHLKSGTSLHAKISSAFAKVTQAYETLTDQDERATYDATLQRSRQYAESAPKATEDSVIGSADELEFERGAPDEESEAEHNFREGFGALRQGQINVAMTRLATAARMSPHEPRYRAYYGRALAADEKTRRLAESELQAAVKLEPSNALYRAMLAELYFDLRFTRRAQTELDRALALDPNNGNALSLLRKIKKSRKAG